MRYSKKDREEKTQEEIMIMDLEEELFAAFSAGVVFMGEATGYLVSGSMTEEAFDTWFRSES